MPSFCCEAILHRQYNVRRTKERGLHLYQWGHENVSPSAAKACPLKFPSLLLAMHLLLPCIMLLWIFPSELCYCLCESDSEQNQTESIPSPPFHITMAVCTTDRAQQIIFRAEVHCTKCASTCATCLEDSTMAFVLQPNGFPSLPASSQRRILAYEIKSLYSLIIFYLQFEDVCFY